MADVVPLLKQGLSTLQSGQLPEVSLLRALVSKVTKCLYPISKRIAPLTKKFRRDGCQTWLV